MSIKILKIILSIVFLCDLFFIYRNQLELRFFTKPLLVPLLVLIYIFKSKIGNLQINKTFTAGLLFSFLGDLFLLFKWGFLPGLGNFLLAHVFYILCFKSLPQKKIKEIWMILISLYVSALIVFLEPFLNEMKIPVIVYGIVIATMLYNSLRTSNKNLILGALLFVISDTLLSVNLFVKETEILSLLVMITYISAQWFLVKGMLSSSKNCEVISN